MFNNYVFNKQLRIILVLDLSHYANYGGLMIRSALLQDVWEMLMLTTRPYGMQDMQCAKRHSLDTWLWVSIAWEGVDIPSRVEMAEASLEAYLNNV